MKGKQELEGYTVCQKCGLLYTPEGIAEKMVDSLYSATSKGAEAIACEACREDEPGLKAIAFAQCQLWDLVEQELKKVGTLA
jgi:hypothetical protein